MGKTIRFVYDIQCPYAFLAFNRIPSLAKACNAKLEYFPVLLGGLYEGTKAPQGKDGSATDIMAVPKQKILADDLWKSYARWGVDLKWNSRHPIRSVSAQRILSGISDQISREKMTTALFKSYWQQDLDISDETLLFRIAEENQIPKDLIMKALQDKTTLRVNTEWAVKQGVFGVPAFFIFDENGKMDERFYFGGDRTFLLAQHLGLPKDHFFGAPHRLTKDSGDKSYSPKLEWFHDFSSPWSYLSSTQVERIAKLHNAQLICKPILLGALFRSIKTPNVPMFELSQAKREYMTRDMHDWMQWWGGIPLTFPSTFPIRTVNALRISIADPKTIPILYKAVWVDGFNIGDDNILEKILNENGFNGKELILKGKEDKELKQILLNNTNEAIERGVCGVPTFSIENGGLIWGQDRFNVVEDELEFAISKKQSKL